MLVETPASSPTRLVLEGTVPGATAHDVTSFLTDPVLVVTWWPEEADIDEGTGDYVMRWPAMGWTLRGTYTVREPGSRVAFTWNWDHEPDTPERTVDILVADDTDGARVIISHGDYGPGDEDERNDHLEGWRHFIGRLADRLD